MRRILLLAVCITLLPGCLATIEVQGGVIGVPPSVSAGGSVSSGGMFAHLGEAAPTAALLGAVLLGILFGDEGNSFRVPDLDPDRAVNVQDCTAPVADISANLRCK